jgi:hypothetical protein
MRFYYNPTIKTTVALKEGAHFGSYGYKEISQDEYDEINGIPSVTFVPEEKPEAEEAKEEEPSVPAKEVGSDIFDSLFSEATANDAQDDGSGHALELDGDILAQEEEAASNSFESIKELRAHADTEREATVTKGKAHGVYSYSADEEKWVRIGDL